MLVVLAVLLVACATGWVHTQLVLRRLKRETREDRERWFRYAFDNRAASVERMRALLDREKHP